MPAYNAFAVRFFKDFRSFVRTNKIPISITVSKEYIGLDTIIPSPKVRKFFEKYLNVFPTSYHPSDIKRLDIFICAASRYCRRGINLYRLRSYLVEDLNWTAKDAEWCFNRIEIGLDILSVKKKFD